MCQMFQDITKMKQSDLFDQNKNVKFSEFVDPCSFLASKKPLYMEIRSQNSLGN